MKCKQYDLIRLKKFGILSGFILLIINVIYFAKLNSSFLNELNLGIFVIAYFYCLTVFVNPLKNTKGFWGELFGILFTRTK